MESNKLLIGVQFVDPANNNKSLVFELIVLRDLTLRQLMDGIKYGLIKKVGPGKLSIGTAAQCCRPNTAFQCPK